MDSFAGARKPRPVLPGSVVRVIAPASPFEQPAFEQGVAEIERMGYRVRHSERIFLRDGYFAGNAAARTADLQEALADPEAASVLCVRGGYSSGELLELLDNSAVDLPHAPKALVGFSDITMLQLYLWKKARWVTFYGPMVAAGFDRGADAEGGYESASLQHALQESQSGWDLHSIGDVLIGGTGEGILLGGCLTLLENTLGTPWELDTRDAILVLEDRAMKPYQVDRSLLHLRQAGKLRRLRGVLLGEFPECDPPGSGGVTVRDVFLRHFQPMGIPVAWNAAIGHTERPMLTIPLGVRATLSTCENPLLRILEPACMGEGD